MEDLWDNLIGSLGTETKGGCGEQKHILWTFPVAHLEINLKDAIPSFVMWDMK